MLLADSFRRRPAASKRAGAFVESRAREMRREFVRRRWRGMALVAFVSITPAVAVAFSLEHGVMRGLLLGVVTTLVACMLTGGVVVLSGSANVTLGAWAEQATAEALEPVLRHGYRVVHHAGLEYGDIDHFLVGPGGVYVLETKWSSREWRLDRDSYARRALDQVRQEAARVELWLRTVRRVPVQAALVLQGAASRGLPAESRVRRSPEGVLVIAGDELEKWALRLPRTNLSNDDIAAITSAMEQQVSKRDLLEPLPSRSLHRAFSDSFTAIVVGFAAFYLPAVAHAWGDTGSLLATGTIACVAVALRRIGAARWSSTAALASCAFWGIVIGATGVVRLVH